MEDLNDKAMEIHDSKVNFALNDEFYFMLLSPEITFKSIEVEITVYNFTYDCNLLIAFRKRLLFSSMSFENLILTESKAFLSKTNFCESAYTILSFGVCAFFPFALFKLNEKWKNIALDLIFKGVKDSKHT